MNFLRHIAMAALFIALSIVFVESDTNAQSLREPARLSISNTQLIHCTPGGASSPGWNAPCFRFSVNVLDDQGDIAAVPSGFKPKVVQTRPNPNEWSVLLTRDTKGQIAGQRKRYVLVLFDISGSMKDMTAAKVSKFEAAKRAADNVLSIFTPGTDFIAVVPFDSQHVVDRVRAARFADTTQAARQQVSQLPQPTDGNTGLYSAVIQGLDVLQQVDRESEKVLMVMTDGMNDVDHPGDDQGLERNIQPALDKVKSTGIAVFTVGFGQPGAIDENALRSLASDRSNFYPAANTDSLHRVLRVAVDRIVNSFQVTTTIKDAQSFEALGRRTFRLRIESGGKTLDSDERDFIPPAFGTPSTELAADEDEAKAYILFITPPPNNRPIWQILTFVFYALVITVMWVFLPKVVWPADAVSNAGSAASVQPIQPIAAVRQQAESPPPRPSARESFAAPAKSQGVSSGTFAARQAAGAEAAPEARAPMDKTKVIRPGSRLGTPGRRTPE
jgi:Mg-chelatase subunit ChlD